jgi:TRAP-type C4-dicarboxylate transport system permease small subunit
MQLIDTGPAGAGQAWRYPFFRTLDQLLRWVSEIPAAILVLLEIVVLLAGVISRYVFNAPADLVR